MDWQKEKRKKIIETFKKYGLAITIKTNRFVVNFLDIQFNLLNSTFKPYRKPNNEPVYVHVYVYGFINSNTQSVHP